MRVQYYMQTNTNIADFTNELDFLIELLMLIRTWNVMQKNNGMSEVCVLNLKKRVNLGYLLLLKQLTEYDLSRVLKFCMHHSIKQLEVTSTLS